MIITNNMKKLCLECIAKSETGSTTPNEKWNTLYWAKIGKSGLSFGPIQFDISTSRSAIECLFSCGVQHNIIKILSSIKRNKYNQNMSISDLNTIEKIAIRETNDLLSDDENLNKIIYYSKKYINYGLDRIASLEDVNLEISDKMILFLMDYHIQFNISINGRLHQWLKHQTELNVENFMMYKYNLKWAKSSQGMKDIDRRYNVLKSFCKEKNIWDNEIKNDSEDEEDNSEMPDWLRI